MIFVPCYRKRYPQWNPVAGILSNGGEIDLTPWLSFF
jgi:hypothetical protein